jgi:hypothetical protein
MNKFTQQTSTPTPLPTPANYADRQFLHTFLAGALLPLVQATITAVMAFIGTMTLLYIFNAIDLLKPALITASVVWVLTWLYLQRRWLNLTAFERMTGIDINGDGQIGKPAKNSEPLVIRLDQVGSNGHYRSQTMALDVTTEQLRILAQGLLNGDSFGERKWTGSGKPFSSRQFRNLRSVWLKRGLLEVVSDKDGRQGFDFTDEGWATLEKLAGVIPEAIEEEDTTDLTDEQMDAIKKENAAYAAKFQA